ncbi:hypothetical protein HPB48_006199 [Haemaphysalis longicornis]|uniref:tRNA (guanine(46)-N(7))-methyltransferase n=1 Tax=Haemaphysalis longicornis TaxID=44386 RepID=A0A9J6FT45_HAELO|nr:hypothetical protein HPB48_006199 [Haemaphysalis longicornis]
MAEEAKVKLPQKRYYRQRAHSNPIADHCFTYPPCPDDMDWSEYFPHPVTGDKQVEFADIGCGYGGLLVALSPMFPETYMVGMEIRVKVSDYVQDRIKALRGQHPGQYENVACIRTNAMKHLPNFFRKGQNIAELGKAPEESAQVLKKWISGRLGKAPRNRILVYALPEKHREEHLTVDYRKWNSSVHQVYEELGLRVEFAAAPWVPR